MTEHNDDTVSPSEFAARPARLADGSIMQPDGSILPRPKPRFTGDMFDLDNIEEIPDAEPDEPDDLTSPTLLNDALAARRPRRNRADRSPEEQSATDVAAAAGPTGEPMTTILPPFTSAGAWPTADELDDEALFEKLRRED